MNSHAFSEVRIGLLVYPPYVTDDQKGLIVSVIEEANLKEEIAISLLPPKRLFLSFDAGKIDLAFVSKISQTPARLRSSTLLRMFSGDTALFFDKRHTPDIDAKLMDRSKSDLKVAVIRGVQFEAEALRKDGFDVWEVETPKQAMRVLTAGRVAFIHMSMVPIKLLLNDEAFRADQKHIKQYKRTYLENPVGLLYRTDASRSIRLAVEKISTVLQDPGKMRAILEDNEIPSELHKEIAPRNYLNR